MFENFQIAFFDYDNTLFVHDYRTSANAAPLESEIEFRKYALNAAPDWQELTVPAMLWCVSQLKDAGCVLICLTTETNPFKTAHKKLMCEINYNIPTVYSVVSDEDKIHAIKAIALLHNIALQNVLYVDDSNINIRAGLKAGVCAMNAMNMCQLYENYLLGELERKQSDAL